MRKTERERAAEEYEEKIRHCDFVAENYSEPDCLRWFIFIHRLPATLKCLVEKKIGLPNLWAKYRGSWRRVTMASRLGDVGITSRLDADYGYDDRVHVDELTEFTDKRPKIEKKS